ncbi:MAG: NAD(P)H-hydrate dehydratase [Clostridia bacterium]|nr:NAD(P)H-hydrate dehydratase [Clostridia bacterium]
MKKVVTPKTMMECDHNLTKELGIPPELLMETAARAVTERVLCALKAQPGHVLILCAAGNNGGDGIAVLRQLVMAGEECSALLLGDPAKLKDAAKLNYEIVCAAGLPLSVVSSEDELNRLWPNETSVIVDALFGTGLCCDLGGMHLAAVQRANRSHAFRIAVDIPSGIHGETGAVLGDAFRADDTVTFQMVKRGHLLDPGREYAGGLFVSPIAPMPKAMWDRYPDEWLEEEDLTKLLPMRAKNSHKGKNGRALLIAGSNGFAGAAIMSAMSALRGGTGLLRIAHPKGLTGAFSAIPEAMTASASDADDWDASSAEKLSMLLDGCDAAAIGPGLGKGEWRKEMLASTLGYRGKLVIDADGLNALAAAPELFEKLHDKVILTPHPAEMARLCGISTKEVLECPAELAREKAAEWGCVVLLKGAVSVIASPDGCVTFNTTGNPGLAKGGSGDVLTGIILAMLSQGLCAYDAARVGAYLLGASADHAVHALAERALLARDVIGTLPSLVKDL